MSGYDNIIISSVNVTHIYSVESAVDLPKAGSAKYQKEPQYERMEVYTSYHAHYSSCDHIVTVGH